MNGPAEGAAGIEITGIAAGGAGVGRLADGRVVFVHRTAPGDLVRVRTVRSRRSWAEAELVEVLRAGPGRREPPCPHYGRCGGCTLEHLAYAAQLDAKATIVRDALQRIGGIDRPPPEVVASPRELRYRNRVSFTLLRLRGGRVVAGFHEIGRPDRVVDVEGRCLLPEAALTRVWDALRAAWGPAAGRLPAGRRLRLTLRVAAAGEAALLVEGGARGGENAEGATALLRDVPGLAAVWIRAAAHAPATRLAGEERLTEAWNDEELALSGGVFLQVNREAAALLEAHVVHAAGTVDGARVVDAYCGVGLHARRFERLGARVVGVERDPVAVAEARRGAPGATFLEGAVEERLAETLPADVVVLNPPRAGLHERVPEALRRTPPRRLVYVSCDPATLARDLARLAPAFSLRSLRCFDLFPQTAHVETVAELTCATS